MRCVCQSLILPIGVSLLQTYIFVLLTTVYAGAVVTETLGRSFTAGFHRSPFSKAQSCFHSLFPHSFVVRSWSHPTVERQGTVNGVGLNGGGTVAEFQAEKN
jgi:hypothetical protein